MERYTLYCTEEQTKKALNLGAPIEYELDCVNGIPCTVTDGDGEPIHLTEDILKANGFGVCYESCYQTKYNLWLLDDEVCVEYKFSKLTECYNYIKIFIDGGERVSIHILNVHELQHALRLCGLNELADNLKIE